MKQLLRNEENAERSNLFFVDAVKNLKNVFSDTNPLAERLSDPTEI